MPWEAQSSGSGSARSTSDTPGGMLYRLAADLIVVLHLGFVVFVVGGGLLALKWRRLAYIHIPAALWGAWIEFAGWICPLTPLENHLRGLAGDAGYAGGFIEHYITKVLYPAGLTPAIQVTLGAVIVVVNGVVYWMYFARRADKDASL